MIDKDQVLKIIKRNGPVLPRDVVKEVGGDTFFVGAVLSQLADSKEIRISHTKIGGSPVYFVAEQQNKLQDLYKYLREKEKNAYDLLKDKKILRDVALEPAIRVAIRNIKDFAKGLEVNLKDHREIFWKWYLTPNTEAETIIRTILKEEPPKQEEQIDPPIEEPIKKETQHKLKQDEVDKGTLIQKVDRLFSEKGIETLETEIIRKNSEIELIIRIPSAVGKLKYFCKVRDKKKSSDKDLSSAYVQGQMKKLPILYVTTGQVTKKAQEMLEKEFKMISVLYL